jgi:PAX-interacting protein 1
MEEADTETGHDLSWIDFKRPKLIIPLANRFGALGAASETSATDKSADKSADKGASDDDPMESESDRELKPPDFCLDNVKNVDGMIKKLTSLTGEKSFTYKCLRDGTVKIMSKTIAVYKALTNFVKDMKLSWYTYQIKSQRSFDVVISGLHKSYQISDLKSFLSSMGHTVRSASVMQRKVFDKNTDRMVTIFMDKFLVHLEPNTNNKDIYSLRHIDHCVVNIEPPHKRNAGPSQCKNCQGRGHTTNFCYRPSVCVKCAGNHHTSKCTITEKDKVKCANCGGDHTANYLGCPDYQQRIKSRAPPRSHVPEFNITDHHFERLPRGADPPPEPQVRNNFSYSEIASQSQFMKRIEELMVKQIQTTNTLMNMMSTLINHLCRK